jgi:Flp pilus assembly protein TadG
MPTLNQGSLRATRLRMPLPVVAAFVRAIRAVRRAPDGGTSRPLSKTRSFRSDTRGVASIEFSFIVSMLVVGLLNAVDLGAYEFKMMEVHNAAQAAAQAAWTNCGASITSLPATLNCPNLNTAVAAAVKSTSLGSSVTFATGFPSEGYYCVNSSNALQFVGSVTNEPTNCSIAGNGAVSPSDYIEVSVTYNYAPLFPGVTIMSVSGITTITATTWMRLG